MASPNYLSMQLKCFVWSGIFVSPRTQKNEGLLFCFKVLCTTCTIFCHSLFCYRNISDVTAVGESFGMIIVLVNSIINCFILLRKRKQILRLKNSIEDLTILNSETNEKSLLRVRSLEQKAVVMCVVILVPFFIGTYSRAIVSTTFNAALGGDFKFEFPTKVAFPYEITSMSTYIASYVVVFYGTYSHIILGVSFQLSSFFNTYLPNSRSQLITHSFGLACTSENI